MSDVLCLGEILVDWVCTTVGAELDRAQQFTKAPGGAPANVAVGLARQGVSTGFLGRVSDDEFGRWLKKVLETDNIDTTGTKVDANAQTRMAYVVTTKTGDRKLAEFTKIACADARLEPSDLNENQFSQAKIFHFGSISLIADPVAKATQKAVELSRKYKMVVSYDPNVRLGLWPSKEACKQKILDTLQWADIVKINLDELEFLTGTKDLAAAERLRQEHQISLLIITLDSNGAFFATAKGSKQVPGFHIQLVEATGAGDGFVASVLAGLLPLIKKSTDFKVLLSELSIEALTEIILRGNATGALTCTRAGAIPALPTKEEVDHFMQQMTAQATT